MSTEYEVPRSELGQRLRREAAAWGGAPSEECSRRWRAALEEGASAAPALRRQVAAAAAAAVVVVGLVTWAIASRSDPEPPARERTPVVWFEDTLERAMQPLEREYDALRVDVDAVADVVWRRMPPPLLRLFGE